MRKIAGLMVCTLLLSGCGADVNKNDPLSKYSKQELMDMVNEQAISISSLNSDIDGLQKLISGYNDGGTPTGITSIMKDGKYTLNSLDDTIVFGNELGYPNSTEASNTQSISVSSNVSFVPSSNWIISMKGTHVELEHINGVTGKLKIADVKNLYDREKLQEEVVEKWFADIRQGESIKYNRIFLGDNWQGIQANGTIMVDENEEQIYCGTMAIGNQSLTYIFVYKGNQDAVKEETITSLIKTIKMYNNVVRIG